MAKQAGIHGLRGKVNGMSYYYSKNGGELTRKINEGIGERVKSSAAYVNTRKNNAEFGAAGAMAGAIMRTIPQKYRYILMSTATGLLNKEIKKLLSLDVNNDWGEREIQTGGESSIQAFFNTLSKNKFPEIVEFYIQQNMKYYGDDNTVRVANPINTPNALVDYLEGIGATHYAILHFGMKVETPVFLHDVGEYSTPKAQITALVNFDRAATEANVTTVMIPDDGQQIEYSLVNDDPSAVTGIFSIFLPIRRVGASLSVLQEHCSAIWISAVEGVNP